MRIRLSLWRVTVSLAIVLKWNYANRLSQVQLLRRRGDGLCRSILAGLEAIL